MLLCQRVSHAIPILQHFLVVFPRSPPHGSAVPPQRGPSRSDRATKWPQKFWSHPEGPSVEPGFAAEIC